MTLSDEARKGNVAAARQYAEVAEQVRRWTGQTGDGGDFFAGLVARLGRTRAGRQREGRKPRLRQLRDVPLRRAGAAGPRQGGRRSRALRPGQPLLPRRRGRPRRDLRLGLGRAEATLGPDGRDRRRDPARRDGRRGGGRTWRPTRRGSVKGREAFRDWMQDLADRTIAEMADVHFDIPEPIRRIECMLAPTNDGGIYYTGPSEDFTRPGRMWWSVPDGIEDFHPVARGHDRLPRGRAGPPPPGRADGLPQGEPEPLAAADVLVQRSRRGLGALRRAADGGARAPRRPGGQARHARRPVDARGPRDRRHRHAPGARDPARTTRSASIPARRGRPSSGSSSCATTAGWTTR